MDMSLMSKFLVQGPDAGAVLNRLSVSAGRRRAAARRLHAVVRRRRRTADRPDGHQARRRPVPGRLQRRHPSARRDDAPPRARAGRGRDHHRRDARNDAALGPGTARPRPVGVAVTRRLVRRGLPLPHGARGRGGVVPVPRAPGHLRRRARLRAAHPGRPGCCRSGRRLVEAGDVVRAPPGGAARDVARCVWRRATATTASTSRTPTTRWSRGWRSRSPGTSRAASSAATRWSHAAATASARMVHVLLDDPEPLLHGGEPLLRDGEWVGYVRAGDYGHTLGSLGRARRSSSTRPASPPTGWREGGFEVDVAGTRVRRPPSPCARSTTPTASGSAGS